MSEKKATLTIDGRDYALEYPIRGDYALISAHAGDQTLPMWSDIWTAIYQAIDD